MFSTHTNIWLLGVAVILAIICHSEADQCLPDEREEFPSLSFDTGVEEFGLSIFKKLANEMVGSIFVSPYSLWSVLGLAYFGSDGRTRAQLEHALNLRSKSETLTRWNTLKMILHSNPQQKSGARFKSTNRAYFSDSLNLQQCLSNVLVDLKKVDFTAGDRAKNIINHDVNITTEGKIEDSIEFLPPTTQFALINAVYFKGLWKSPFKPTKTRLQEFLIHPGVAGGIVSMMVQHGSFNHGYAPSLEATLLELPYANSEVSMFLILPDTLSTDRVMELLSRQSFREAYTQMTKKFVDVGLPKFKLTTKVEQELKSSLYLLGITDLFEPGVANLTAFTKTKPIHVDTAIHEATVEVTEEGTVAAAASGLINTRFGGIPVNFFCNRPFIFLITDKGAGVTLFAGNLVHPGDIEEL